MENEIIEVMQKTKAEIVLQKDKEDRLKRCQEKISDVLKSENCNLEAECVINKSGVTAFIKVVAL